MGYYGHLDLRNKNGNENPASGLIQALGMLKAGKDKKRREHILQQRRDNPQASISDIVSREDPDKPSGGISGFLDTMNPFTRSRSGDAGLENVMLKEMRRRLRPDDIGFYTKQGYTEDEARKARNIRYGLEARASSARGKSVEDQLKFWQQVNRRTVNTNAFGTYDPKTGTTDINRAPVLDGMERLHEISKKKIRQIEGLLGQGGIETGEPIENAPIIEQQKEPSGLPALLSGLFDDKSPKKTEKGNKGEETPILSSNPAKRRSARPEGAPGAIWDDESGSWTVIVNGKKYRYLGNKQWEPM